MINTDDLFLKDLQDEFLKDPENHLGLIKESISKLSADPVASLKAIGKTLQTVKSHLEPLNFKFFANLVGEFEHQVLELEAAFVALQGQHQTDDIRVLEFFMNDVHQNFESYYQALRGDGRDGEDKAEYRRPSVRILASWRPTVVVAETTVEAPLAVMPETSVEIPAPVAEAALSPQPETPVHESMPAPVQAKDNVIPFRASAAPASGSAADDTSDDKVSSEGGTKAIHQYLMCRASLYEGGKVYAQRAFAIPIRQVLEVIEQQVVNRLPYPRQGIAGILNFRGDPLPILVCNDCGDRMPQTEDRKAGYVVISRIGDRTFGFEMEQVLSVTNLNPSEFQAPEGLLNGADSSWITHLVKTENEVVMVMDLNKALAA